MAVAARLPGLERSQARARARFRYGMVLARSWALTAVSGLLAALLGKRENTLRQYLRETVSEAGATRGHGRRAVAIRSCFAPLRGWVRSLWEGRQLALALDATSLGGRFGVLVIRVVYRGGAIPVSWTVLPAGEPHAWRGEWLRMLGELRPAVPRDFVVIGLAGRGLSAGWLYRRIVRLGWHPLLRLNLGGRFRPAGAQGQAPVRPFAPTPGTAWQGTGSAFKTPQRRLPCPLLARWEPGHTDPWRLLTDRAPEAAEAGWYGLRAWIEPGFTRTKRGGFPWQRTRMTDPDRAARLWLAVARATRWLLRVGGEADAVIAIATFPDRPLPPRRQRAAPQVGRLSTFHRVLQGADDPRRHPRPFGQ